MKNVLFITYYWPPSGKASLHWPLKIIKHLPDFGYVPVVLTVTEDKFSHKDDTFINEIPESVKVVRSNTIEPFDFYKKFTGKIIGHIAWKVFNVLAIPPWETRAIVVIVLYAISTFIAFFLINRTLSEKNYKHCFLVGGLTWLIIGVFGFTLKFIPDIGFVIYALIEIKHSFYTWFYSGIIIIVSILISTWLVELWRNKEYSYADGPAHDNHSILESARNSYISGDFDTAIKYFERVFPLAGTDKRLYERAKERMQKT